MENRPLRNSRATKGGTDTRFTRSERVRACRGTAAYLGRMPCAHPRSGAFDPQVKAILSSGYSADTVMADFQTYGFNAVVPKPYRLQQLSQVVRRVIQEQHHILAFNASLGHRTR